MLPTNVMSFMKKMVATDETQAQSSPETTGGTFGKLKQTLSSSLLTAQDKVHKMSPRPSLVPEADGQLLYNESGHLSGSAGQQQQSQLQQQQQQANNQHNNNNNNKGEPGKPPSRAGACRVCLKSFKPDDYSKTCFECQQRVCEDCASYSKLDENEDANTWRCSVCRRKMASRVCIPQDSTDSMLDVPVLEALQRRHSDVKLGSSTTLAPGDVGLAPPRSPELRRHSDVSPASLKELEKLKGSKTPGGDTDWRRGGRSVAPSRSSSPPRRSDFDAQAPPAGRIASRRGSRVARQHSYDDDIKSVGLSGGGNAGGGGGGPSELGLGIPAMPRRKSAYDVFAPGILQAAANQVAGRGPTETFSHIPPVTGPGSRRPSFRVPHPDDLPQNDDSPSPDQSSPVLTVDEDRRMRRRGSQLPDIAALRDRGALPITLNPVPPPIAAFTGPALEDLEAPRRQTSMDGEAIKIVIHDVDSGPICASKRRVVLRRDPTDKAHRTRGFGMRVVGGKTGADGRLFAYIVWTVPGGPAEKGGLQQGDKILEWNGMSLIDRSFEEVCAIMDRTGDVVELLVEHATDFRMCDLLEDGVPPGSGGNQSGPRKSADGPIGLGLVADPDASVDKSPSSPTRRKLPKTPEQIARVKQVSGRIQIQVWYHGERSELVVSLMAADDLALRDDSLGHGSLPEAYAKVQILPKTGDGNVSQTEVSPPTQNPIWNATLTFSHITADNLMDRFIEIQLWDLVPHTESVFLGECNVELQKAFLEDRALWCRLEDPKGLRASSISKSPNVSPRGSIGGDVSRLIRRCDYTMQRSISDDVDSIGDGASLLHPDHAWIAGSRRGSSQSETLEVEVYQLGKDFSRSLPGSRRSSFQDADKNKEEEIAQPPPAYLRDRRRSSVARRDPDEILKSLKAVRGELGRAMSLSGPEMKRPQSRRPSRVRKDSVFELPEHLPIGIGNTATSPPSDDEKRIQPPSRWKGSGSIKMASTTCLAKTVGIGGGNLGGKYTSLSGSAVTLANNIKMSSSVTNVNKIKQTTEFSSSFSSLTSSSPYVKLGPGQIHPKGYRLTSGRYGELKLGLSKMKGIIEVEVICARNIVPIDCEAPPDTYVKCYLKDGDRLRNKKKTRVVRHSAEPMYKQTLKYQTSDIFGRNLVIMVWQRCIGFEHNQGLGGAELTLDKINLSQYIGGWYPLFPMHTLGGSDSNDSP